MQSSKADESSNRIEGKVTERVFTAITLDEILTAMLQTNKLLQSQKPEGKEFPISLTVPAGTLVHVDFINGRHDNIPTGTKSFVIPGTPFFSMNLINYGPGTLYFKSNELRNSHDSMVPLAPNEVQDLNASYAVFRSVNLIADGADSTVKIVGMI